MFTGIVQNVVRITKTEKFEDGIKITFEKPSQWHDLQIGESIAFNGVCLTVAQCRDELFECFIMAETLSKTTFGKDIPSLMNAERALLFSDRLNGHIVQGHVDDLGGIEKISKSDGWRVTVKYDNKYSALNVLKGSITIDGVSLTIASLTNSKLSVALIPYTLQHTTLGSLQKDDFVNLEFDILGKYVQRNLKRE